MEGWLRLTAPAALVTALVLGAGPTPASAQPEPGVGATAPATTKVLLISVDALGSRSVRALGPARAPTLHRMLAEGVGTLEARTARELTETLPNHTSMVTGRRVDDSHGGHGVTWNDERLRPRTVQAAAGHRVGSLFGVVDSRRRDPALFTGKRRLLLFERSWPAAIDRVVLRQSNARLVRMARHDLVTRRRALTMLHLTLPDDVGHEQGFGSPAHLRAVARTDRLLGRLLRAILSRPRLREHLTVVLTSDHGGWGTDGHGAPADPANFRIPFLVWGAGVARGEDLYDLNHERRDPGRRRTSYGDRRQPVRNGDAANLVTELLGLGSVPGSQFDRHQRLDVSR
ncbi:alkaline phosphatase family protein [Nocardioides euryhalodurans]|uniref:Alkaline phosphatase family protein n=1 Tax=Nocardioides euryhalodurans TaxID=2518370 RepID=A0A4P7GPV5_9ACTN|nr:alkaline phosphatase family protein [Nocardioides euryhalodurans]QBR93841.1 hypothetical protein EXE57_17295 [Nocardioides euryhalodurans]